MSVKVEIEAEACCVCSKSSLELSSPEEYDAGAPPHQPPLRAMLLHLNNNKVVPNGRLCSICIRRTLDAYQFSSELSSKGPVPLSEKIRALRKRLHELTQKIDVFIVVGSGAAGGEGAYSEQDIIMVERGALAASTRADAAALSQAPDARGDPVYQCTVCPLSFHRMSEFRVHVGSHSTTDTHTDTDTEVHWCWCCGAQLPTLHELEVHAAGHAPPSPLHCTLCSLTLQSSAEYRRHESTCPSVCPACDVILPSRASLRSHITTEAMNEGDGTTTTSSRCEREGRGGGGGQGHGVVCSDCYTVCPSVEARCAHALIHRRERHFVCGYRACILRFHTRSNLLAHIRKCHGGEETEGPPSPSPAPALGAPTTPAPGAGAGAPSKTCTHCNKTFGSVGALKRHARVHQTKRDNYKVDTENMDMEWGDDVEKIEYLEVETLDDMEHQADITAD